MWWLLACAASVEPADPGTPAEADTDADADRQRHYYASVVATEGSTAAVWEAREEARGAPSVVGGAAGETRPVGEPPLLTDAYRLVEGVSSEDDELVFPCLWLGPADALHLVWVENQGSPPTARVRYRSGTLS